MPHPPPPASSTVQLLDRLFEKSPVDGRLISAVIDRLMERDPSLAMTVIEVLLDEAAARLPEDERRALLRDFAALAR